MSKGAVNFQENKVEYYTPYEVVHAFGEFEYDPATTWEQAKRLNIPYFADETVDGLKTDWTKFESIWINPPFNKKKEFFQKACDTYRKVNNHICILLPISFLATKAFHEILSESNCTINIPAGRIKFIDRGEVAKSPAFGSVIIEIGGEACVWHVFEL